MLRLTNLQADAFVRACLRMEEVVLDNDRGEAMTECFVALQPKSQAFRIRQAALHKEKDKLIKDLAKKDTKGNICYGDSPDGKPENRPVMWRNAKAAAKAWNDWVKKCEEHDARIVTVDCAPLPPDFFKKPTKLTIEQMVRTAFWPLLASQQRVVESPPARTTKKK